MKRIAIGANELHFQFLRDLPYYQPASNYYGLKVRSQDTGIEKMILVRDVSPNPDSYQLFLVTGTTGTEVLGQAVVKMLPYGSWYLDAYACSGNSLSDVTTERLYSGFLRSSE